MRWRFSTPAVPCYRKFQLGKRSPHLTSDSVPRPKTLWQLSWIIRGDFDSLNLSTLVRTTPALFPSFLSSAYLLGIVVYGLRHGYTATERSRAAFVLRRNISKALVDVRFNACVAFDCWRLIDAIENSNVNIDASLWAGGHGIPSQLGAHISRFPGRRALRVLEGEM